MEFDLHKLEKYIKILTDNYKIKLDELDKHPNIKDSYELVNKITINNDNKDDITKLITKQYRPTQIMPDTVGSFLFGCFQETYGDIPAECSPLCAYSINNGENVSMEKCDSQIYIQYFDVNDESEQRFVKLGNSKSPQAYIFVKLNYIGFTSHEKGYLISQGVTKVQILVTKDSKHHTVIRMRNLDDIPIIEKIGNTFYINSNSSMNSDQKFEEKELKQTDDITIVYILFAVIIVGMMISVSRN